MTDQPSDGAKRIQTTAGRIRPVSGLKVQTRHYLASSHLWAAMVAARQCRELETALRRGERPIDATHRGYAITAIMSSVAFLEALINETYADAAEGTVSRIDALSPQCIQLMKEYWLSAADRTSLLSKAQMALLFAGESAMDRGAQVWQNVDLLISWRNALVHFKPSWHNDEQPSKIETRLVGKFAKE